MSGIQNYLVVQRKAGPLRQLVASKTVETTLKEFHMQIDTDIQALQLGTLKWTSDTVQATQKMIEQDVKQDLEAILRDTAYIAENVTGILYLQKTVTEELAKQDRSVESIKWKLDQQYEDLVDKLTMFKDSFRTLSPVGLSEVLQMLRTDDRPNLSPWKPNFEELKRVFDLLSRSNFVRVTILSLEAKAIDDDGVLAIAAALKNDKWRLKKLLLGGTCTVKYDTAII
ncbi:hypothetical protein HDU93_009347 [Gonapodya sp. JEL0774]|nr:hypothetical protein HDU93_009347 [Gonapodya sp. JEL0774]